MNIKNLRTVSLVIILFLTAMMLSGCSGYVIVDNNEAPTAKIISDKLGRYAPLKVVFDGSTSSDSDGNIISYDWEFGDGSTAQGVQTEHTFQDDGLYTVRLTVIDDEGATNSTTTNIKVLNPKPQVSFNFSPNVPLVGETVRFDAGQTFDPASVQPEYVKKNGFEWTFGDGTSANGITVNKSYSKPGYYDVTLKAEDDDGAVSSITKEIEVEAVPEPYFSWEIVEIRYSSNSDKTQPQLEPQVRKVKIKFDASDSYDNESIQRYEWNFGDGNYETTQYSQITHWFDWGRNDSYKITLTVVDNEGLTSSLTKRISS